MNNLIRQRQQNNRIAEQRIQQEIKEFNQLHLFGCCEVLYDGFFEVNDLFYL